MRKLIRTKHFFLSIISIFLVGFTIPLGTPNQLINKLNRPGVVWWHGARDKPEVALTFDDGPNEPYTSEILKVLDKYQVKATFFMLGKNVEKHPEVAGAIAKAGHAIGNHSYTHWNLIIDTPTQILYEINLADTTIQKVTGVKPYLFRPPFGGDDPWVFDETEKLGYVVVKWSLSSKDWERPGAAQIVQNVFSGVQNGSIIQLHDGETLHHGADRSQTVSALPSIIVGLKKRGYKSVTVPVLLRLEK